MFVALPFLASVWSILFDRQCISDWLLANKLSSNVAKSESMFTGSDDKLDKIKDASYVYVNRQPVRRVKLSKSLGLNVDERLDWVEQIDFIAKKVSSATGGLRQAWQFINHSTAITIYNSLIQPFFDYCDIIWDNYSATQKTRLQKPQNRAARVITQQSYDIRSYEIREQLGWGTLADRRSKNGSIMMYKILNGAAPFYLEDVFQTYPSRLNYSFRSRYINILLAKPKTEYLKKSFKFCGAKLWN